MPARERIRVSAPADEPAIAEVLTSAFGDQHGPVVARLVEALRTSPAWDPALSFAALSTSGQTVRLRAGRVARVPPAVPAHPPSRPSWSGRCPVTSRG